MSDPKVEKAITLAAEAAGPALMTGANSDKVFSITSAAVDHILNTNNTNLVASNHALYALGTVARRVAKHNDCDFTAHHLIPRLVDSVKAQTKEHKTDVANTALLCNSMKALQLLCEVDSTLAPNLATKDIPHPQKSNDVAARVTSMALFPSIIGFGNSITADAYAYIRKGMEATVSSKVSSSPKDAEFQVRFAAMSSLHKCLGPAVTTSANNKGNKDVAHLSGMRRNRFETPDLAIAALEAVSKMAFDLQFLAGGGEEQMMIIGELLGHLLCYTSELETLHLGGSGSSGGAAGGSGGTPNKDGGLSSFWRGSSKTSGTNKGGDHHHDGNAAGGDETVYDFSTAAAETALRKMLALVKANPKSIQGYVIAGCLATIMHTHLAPKVGTLGSKSHHPSVEGSGRGASLGRSGSSPTIPVQVLESVWKILLAADTDLEETLKSAMGRFVVIAMKHWNEVFLLACDSARTAIVGSLSGLLSASVGTSTKHGQLAALHSLSSFLQQMSSTYTAAEISEHLPHLTAVLYETLTSTGTIGTAASEALAHLVAYSPSTGHAFAEKLTMASTAIIDQCLRGESYTAAPLELHRSMLHGLSKVAHSLSAEAASTHRMHAALMSAATATGFPELFQLDIATEERFADLLKRVEAFSLYFGCLCAADAAMRTSAPPTRVTFEAQTKSSDMQTNNKKPTSTQQLTEIQQQSLSKILWGLVVAFNAHPRPTSNAGVAACHRSAASLLHAINTLLTSGSSAAEANTQQLLTTIPFKDLTVLLEPLVSLPTSGNGSDESPLAIRAYGEAFVTIRSLQCLIEEMDCNIDVPHLPPNDASLNAAFSVLYKATAQGTQTPLTYALSTAKKSSRGHGSRPIAPVGNTGAASPTSYSVQSLLGPVAPPAETIQTLLFGNLADTALPIHLGGGGLGPSTTKALALDAATMCIVAHFTAPDATSSQRYDIIARIFDILTELDATFEPGSPQQKTLMWNIVCQLWLLLDHDAQKEDQKRLGGVRSIRSKWNSEDHQQLAVQLVDQLHRVFMAECAFPEVRAVSSKAIGALLAVAGGAQGANSNPLLQVPLSPNFLSGINNSTNATAEFDVETAVLLTASEVAARDPGAHAPSLPTLAQKLLTSITKSIQLITQQQNTTSCNSAIGGFVAALQAIVVLSKAATGRGSDGDDEENIVESAAAAEGRAALLSIVGDVWSGIFDKLHGMGQTSSNKLPYYFQQLLVSAGAEFVLDTNVLPTPVASCSTVVSSVLIASQVHPEVNLFLSPVAASAERRLFAILSRAGIGLSTQSTGQQQQSTLVLLLSDFLFRQHAVSVRYKAKPAAMHLAASLNVPFHIPLFTMMEEVLNPGARDILGHLITAHVRSACTFVNPGTSRTIEQVTAVCAQIVSLKPTTTVAGLATFGPDGSPLGCGGAASGLGNNDTEEMPEDAQSSRGLSQMGGGAGSKKKAGLLSSAEVSTKILVFELMTLIVKSPHAKQIASGDGIAPSMPADPKIFQMCVNTIVTLAVQADVTPQLQPAALSALVAVVSTFGQVKRSPNGPSAPAGSERPVLEDWSVQLFGVVRDLIRASTTTGEVPMRHMASFDGVVAPNSPSNSSRGATPSRGRSAQDLKAAAAAATAGGGGGGSSNNLDNMFASIAGPTPDQTSEQLHNENAIPSVDQLLFELVTLSLASNIATDSTCAKFAMAMLHRVQELHEHHQTHLSKMAQELVPPTLRSLMLNPLAGLQLNLAATHVVLDRNFTKATAMFKKLLLQAFTRTAVADEDPSFNVYLSDSFVAFIGQLILNIPSASSASIGYAFKNADEKVQKRLVTRQRLASLIAPHQGRVVKATLASVSVTPMELANTLVSTLADANMKMTPAQQSVLGALLQFVVASGAIASGNKSTISFLVKSTTRDHSVQVIDKLLERRDYASIASAADMLVAISDASISASSSSGGREKTATSSSPHDVDIVTKAYYKLSALVVERILHESKVAASSNSPSFELLTLSQVLLQLVLSPVGQRQKDHNEAIWAAQLELAMTTFGRHVFAAAPSVQETLESAAEKIHVAVTPTATRGDNNKNNDDLLAKLVHIGGNAASSSAAVVGFIAVVVFGRQNTQAGKLPPLFHPNGAADTQSIELVVCQLNAFVKECRSIPASSITALCHGLESVIFTTATSIPPNAFAATALVSTLISRKGAAAHNTSSTSTPLSMHGSIHPSLAESSFKLIFKLLFTIKYQHLPGGWNHETRGPNNLEEDLPCILAIVTVATVASVVLSENECFKDSHKALMVHKGLMKVVEEFGVQIRDVVATLPPGVRDQLRLLMQPPVAQQQAVSTPTPTPAPASQTTAAPPAGRPAKLSINISAFQK